jgi:cytochrome P450
MKTRPVSNCNSTGGDLGQMQSRPELTLDEAADEKVMQIDQLPKSKPAFDALRTVLGKSSIVAIEGDQWKRLRKMFNPAFAQSHLDTLIPAMVEECEIFAQRLEDVADTGTIIEMNHFTTVLPISSLTNLSGSRLISSPGSLLRFLLV